MIHPQPTGTGRSPDRRNHQSSIVRVLSSENRMTDPSHDSTVHTSNTNIGNAFLEPRGRIPPKRFSGEDFRSPDVRRKRTIKDREEETESHEEQTQLKRKK
ncbi:Hypothetical predicted protein [Pelobates cultripes]|uniref:Uncharacterized protein n=1 Tax=Pelobates cultripes TaxID=61616 RepID=A0AAD1R131_PELCU|nr:Hypothetical predicted protein [Pelobates cultripes]